MPNDFSGNDGLSYIAYEYIPGSGDIKGSTGDVEVYMYGASVACDPVSVDDYDTIVVDGVNATGNVCDVVDYYNYTVSLYRSMYTQDHFFSGLDNEYAWTGGAGTWENFPDGTARLTGNVFVVDDPSYGFDVDMYFVGPFDWTTWSSMGNTYKEDLVDVGDNYLDWMFYDFDASKTKHTYRNWFCHWCFNGSRR